MTILEPTTIKKCLMQYQNRLGQKSRDLISTFFFQQVFVQQPHEQAKNPFGGHSMEY